MVPIKPVLVIYNPAAGRGRVLQYWPRVAKALRDAGVLFEAVATKGPSDAVRLAEEGTKQYSAIVGVGGDGTIHEIVNGLMRASQERETLPLGVIPLGNGDDFAKIIPPETKIGSKQFGWEEAVQKIAGRNTRLFDVGRIRGGLLRPEMAEGPQYFMNGMDIGFGAQTMYNLKRIPKFLTGLSAYLTSVVMTLINYKIPKLRLEMDGFPPFEQETTLTAIMNGRCFGRGFWVCPEASADDGLFDVLVGEAVGRLNIIRLVPSLMKGEHLHERVLKIYRTKRIVIESVEPLTVEVDGEIPYAEAKRLEIELLPGILRVFV